MAGHEVVIGLSIGVAVLPGDGQSVAALLSRSDEAFYLAKENRGGYVPARDVPAPSPAEVPTDASAAQMAA